VRAKYGRAVFEYVLRQVGGETGRFVEEIWFARGRITGVRERIAPTGSTVAAFVLGDPILQTPVGQGTALLADTGFLIGPHDRPIVNEPQGETYCVGIVTTPVGCRPTLGLAPATLRGRIVDLPQAWPRAAGLRRELTSCRTPAEALDLIEAAVRTPEPFDRNAFDRCEAAVRQLSAEPTRPVSEIATGLGVSHGYLDRQFSEQVGLSPRTLARICLSGDRCDETAASQGEPGGERHGLDRGFPHPCGEKHRCARDTRRARPDPASTVRHRTVPRTARPAWFGAADGGCRRHTRQTPRGPDDRGQLDPRFACRSRAFGRLGPASIIQ
jgi:hypothetical protein